MQIYHNLHPTKSFDRNDTNCHIIYRLIQNHYSPENERKKRKRKEEMFNAN